MKLRPLLLIFAALLVSCNIGNNADRTAQRVSSRLEKRVAKLDILATELLDKHAVQWPDIGDVPEDMVLYRYVSDTLNCWYNLFSVRSDDISQVRLVPGFQGMRRAVASPLARAGADPMLVNMGGKWYLLKAYFAPNRKVVAGLLIMGNPSPGDNGINRHLLRGGNYTVTTLGQDGSTVSVAGTPVFKIVDGGSHTEGVFSPMFNTDAGEFGTLGNVLFYNIIIFLVALLLYFRRKQISRACTSSRRAAIASMCGGLAIAFGIMTYCMVSLVGVIENSPITLEPRRFTSLDWYSLLIFASYASLCVAAFLVSDLALSIFNMAFKQKLTLRKSTPALICAILFSFALCSLITRCEFNKEQRRMYVISERIAGETTPQSSHFLPPFFSYAKYRDGKLVDFRGNFAYPLMIFWDHADKVDANSQHTILSNGYRHFINYVNADEIIILSREEMGFISFFVMFSFIVIFLFAVMCLFHEKDEHKYEKSRFFSTKIRRLLILSLTATLVIMATVSVVFVYQRNYRNQMDMMSAKISSVQIMLDSYCRDKNSYKELLSPQFSSKFQETGRTVQGGILLYSPSGRLIQSSLLEFTGHRVLFGRLDPEAFRKICIGHERYCILEREMSGRKVFFLFAPVVNAEGNIIAIVCIPNVERDLNFMRDAVFHAAALVSVFMFILFIVVLVVSSITHAIFMPLREMGKKMSAKKPSDLEPIDYKGVDEISVLVEAYNQMVMTMRSSTMQLAQAERNKAWSEMARQVAHEIKNPLTPIKLELQRIIRLKQKGDPSWEEKFSAASAVILEHIDILSQTASEFSTFANLYSEPPVEIDLGKLLQDQIFLFEGKGVKITLLDMENAICCGPRPQLTRVFFNLLNNAVQAVEDREEPQIMVSLRRGEIPTDGGVGGIPGWVVSIEDNGPGVSDENLGKLFTPNFTTKTGGTGLGLSICRNVIENCGGTITYSRSFTLGGACFCVVLRESLA